MFHRWRLIHPGYSNHRAGQLAKVSSDHICSVQIGDHFTELCITRLCLHWMDAVSMQVYSKYILLRHRLKSEVVTTVFTNHSDRFSSISVREQLLIKAISLCYYHILHVLSIILYFNNYKPFVIQVLTCGGDCQMFW